jgi:hypothetical protein
MRGIYLFDEYFFPLRLGKNSIIMLSRIGSEDCQTVGERGLITVKIFIQLVYYTTIRKQIKLFVWQQNKIQYRHVLKLKSKK